MTHVVLSRTDLDRGLASLRENGPDVVVLVDDATDADALEPLLDLLESRPDLDGVVTCGPVADTLKRVDADARVVGTSDREAHRRLDWPQAFRVAALPAQVGPAEAPDTLVRAVLTDGGTVYALETA